MSPALEGGFLTTGPPKKSRPRFFTLKRWMSLMNHTTEGQQPSPKYLVYPSSPESTCTSTSAVLLHFPPVFYQELLNYGKADKTVLWISTSPPSRHYSADALLHLLYHVSSPLSIHWAILSFGAFQSKLQTSVLYLLPPKKLQLKMLSKNPNELFDQPNTSFWRREWQPTPVFLPGEFHGQRRLVGYSPWGPKESDVTERLTHTHIIS